jgi:hypothetical protein
MGGTPLWSSRFWTREQWEGESREGRDAGGLGPGGARPRRHRRTPAAGRRNPQPSVRGSCETGKGKCLGFFQGLPADRPFIPPRCKGGRRILICGAGWLRSGGRRARPDLAQAGDACGPLRRPARRFLGRRPRRARGDGRGLVFPMVRHEQ